MPEGWFHGEAAASGGGGPNPPINARGTLNVAGVTSGTITLDAGVATTDTIVICGYSNAGTPGIVAFSGLGATWVHGNQGPFVYAIGTSPTAGTTAITVSYPFTSTFVFLAAAFGRLSAVTSITKNGNVSSTVDVSGGVSTTNGRAVIIGWALYSGVTAGVTTSFTDSFGSYSVVTPLNGGGVVVEMAVAAVVGTGVSNHVGHRSDTPTYTGGDFIFGLVPSGFEGWS